MPGSRRMSSCSRSPGPVRTLPSAAHACAWDRVTTDRPPRGSSDSPRWAPRWRRTCFSCAGATGRCASSPVVLRTCCRLAAGTDLVPLNLDNPAARAALRGRDRGRLADVTGRQRRDPVVPAQVCEAPCRAVGCRFPRPQGAQRPNGLLAGLHPDPAQPSAQPSDQAGFAQR